jgi:hypothetical protein
LKTKGFFGAEDRLEIRCGTATTGDKAGSDGGGVAGADRNFAGPIGFRTSEIAAGM